MTITAPAQGSTLAVTSTTVTGTTAPGSAVTVASADTTTGAPTAVTSTTAAADGSFSATVPVSFGTPGSGWGFSVVLTGQDGFSPDQARAFSQTAQPFAFGVCALGGTAAICKADPGTVPKAVDVITPPGVSQATELDPTLGPVVIQPVLVP